MGCSFFGVTETVWHDVGQKGRLFRPSGECLIAVFHPLGPATPPSLGRTALSLLSHQYPCVIDRQIVLDGSFNWYNTSVVSHDMLIVLNHYDIAQLYLQEADQILSSFHTLWLTDAR